MPTINVQVGSNNADCRETSAGAVSTGTNSRLNTSFPFIALLFENVGIPAGATIDVAYVQIYGDHPSLIEFTGLGDFCAEDDCAPWSQGTTFDLSSRTLTGNPVSINITLSTSGYTNTPSLVAALQAVIDRGGWASGQDIGFIVEHDGSADNAQYVSYDESPSTAAVLHVEYTEGGGGDTDLAVDDLAVAVSLALAVLSQLIDLAANGLQVAALLDSPVLEQVFSLAAGEQQTATSFEGAQLVQEHDLAVENLAVNGFLDAPEIDQVFDLQTADLSVQPAFEAPALTTGQELAVEDLAGAVGFEAPALEQTIDIAAVSLEVITSLEAPASTSGQQLASEGVLVGSQLDSPVLEQVILLAVEDLAAAALLDGVIVEQVAQELQISDLATQASFEAAQLEQTIGILVVEMLVNARFDSITLVPPSSQADLAVSDARLYDLAVSDEALFDLAAADAALYDLVVSDE